MKRLYLIFLPLLGLAVGKSIIPRAPQVPFSNPLDGSPICGKVVDKSSPNFNYTKISSGMNPVSCYKACQGFGALTCSAFGIGVNGKDCYIMKDIVLDSAFPEFTGTD